ncbi:MAG: nicotinamide-nucleotide adenylyltransferase [Nanoarchaeota archaeon]|nr:nicotinamide-nucleotide adenylyltransferase [Nanoarchaeota archaeon]
MIALFIGRFQPFHKGHLAAMKQMAKEVDKIIIGIGSSQYLNEADNPFSAEERIEMIKAALGEDFDYEIILIPDINDDERWVEHVCDLVPEFDVVYTGNSHTKMLFEDAGISVKDIELVPGINGTTIRDMIINNEDYSELIPVRVLEILKRLNVEERIRNI